MNYIIQLSYIGTVIIGVMCLVMHIMVRAKNLSVSNKLVKSGSTGMFLGVIAAFNMCDFLIVFLRDGTGDEIISWILIIENVLEVVMAYALINMAKEYADCKTGKGLLPLFMCTASVILLVDIMYTNGTLPMSENCYMSIMIILNALPLAVAAVCGAGVVKSIIEGSSNPVINAYLVIYGVVFFFLCTVTTLSIIDSRTEWDYFRNDKEIYIIFWLVFNILNGGLIWESCTVSEEKKEEEPFALRLQIISEDKGLSAREKEIALLLYEGINNNEIAERLFLSTNTVKVHTSNLYRKLGVSNRVQAMRFLGGEVSGK